eukprot:ANDGO_02403.mRNA.1 putative membrane protein At1g06890
MNDLQSMNSGSSQGRIVFVSLITNVVSSTLTIVLNKVCSSNEVFRFGTLLTVFHFTFMNLVLYAMSLLGYVQLIDIPTSVKLPLVSAYAGYVFFNNVSLISNSVSFYQITKLLVTPIVLFVQHHVYDIKVSRRTKLSLVPLLIGSSVYISTDLSTSFVGAIFAILATVSNAMYTVWGGTMQKKTHASGLQMLYHQSLWSAIILSPCIFIFDDYHAILNSGFSLKTLGFGLLTGPCALFLNLSFFVFVGRTSPLTANVLGYLKTALILVIGITYFGDRLDMYSIFGLSCTLLGLFLYSKTKIDEAK